MMKASGMLGQRPWRMLRAGLGLACLASLGALAALSLPSARAEGVVKATNGDWETRCDTPIGAKGEQCALVQNVVAEDRPNITLVVIVLKPVDKKKPLMRVVAPPFVFLPTGLGLKIDGQDIGNAPFLKCSKRGCIAEVVLQDEVIKKMMGGGTAMFIIFDTPEAGIGIPVSLQGFGDALANLK